MINCGRRCERLNDDDPNCDQCGADPADLTPADDRRTLHTRPLMVQPYPADGEILQSPFDENGNLTRLGFTNVGLIIDEGFK